MASFTAGREEREGSPPICCLMRSMEDRRFLCMDPKQKRPDVFGTDIWLGGFFCIFFGPF